MALLAAMILAGTVGGVVGRALSLSVPLCVVAGAALGPAQLCLPTVDTSGPSTPNTRRWSRDEVSEVKALAQRLREMGYEVSYAPPEPEERDHGYPSLRVRQRDWRAVRRLIDDASWRS